VNRTPPAAVRRELRREVGFGCPIPDCGIPYLTWHHFDPEWRVEEHHRPEGMIALCLTHAGLADECAARGRTIRIDYPNGDRFRHEYRDISDEEALRERTEPWSALEPLVT